MSSRSEPLWGLTAKGPWGDYGRILMHGMSAHRARVGDRIQLERTAPFVPPLSLPGIGDVIVTNEFRGLLEKAGVSGITFRALDKVHVVRSSWHLWDRSAEAPPIYPESGEPEDYLLAEPHDPAAADSLGELWELVPDVGGLLASERVSRTPRRFRFTLQRGTDPGLDVFRVGNMRYVLVTERVRNILVETQTDAVEVHPVEVGDLPEPKPPEQHHLKPGDPVPDGYEVTRSYVSPFTGESMRLATRIA